VIDVKIPAREISRSQDFLCARRVLEIGRADKKRKLRF